MPQPTGRRLNRARAILDIAATLAMLVASGAVAYHFISTDIVLPAEPPEVIPSSPLDISGAKLKGNHEASVVLLEFSEFECPYCARFVASTLPKLLERYVDSGEVLFAFRHLPLRQIHPHAVEAAAASECAVASGQFWSMHDLLFQDQANLFRTSLEARAAVLGLEPDRFRTCVEGSGLERVEADAAIAAELGIRSTPYFLIGQRISPAQFRATRALRGARPFTDFQKALDEELAERR
jgi:protein-disulfide isomerase